MAQTTTATDAETNPDSRLSAHYRKIELQSHADLTYLQQNLAKAAREKLDLHFPPASALKAAAPAEVINLGGAPESTPSEDTANKGVEEEEDPLRARVRALVDSFLAATYQSAAHSISVNGMDATSLPAINLPSCTSPFPSGEKDATPLDPEQEIEGIHYTYSAFDPALQKKLANLHGELESLIAQVSKLRREAPKSAADAYRTQLEAALLKDEEQWEAEQARLQNEKHTGLKLEPLRRGWNDDVKEIFETGVSSLAALSGVAPKSDGASNIASLTETVGKTRRAANIAQEFE